MGLADGSRPRDFWLTVDSMEQFGFVEALSVHILSRESSRESIEIREPGTTHKSAGV